MKSRISQPRTVTPELDDLFFPKTIRTTGRILALLIVGTLITGCGDNLHKTFNKGGLKSDREYTFHMMKISNIKASDETSVADFYEYLGTSSKRFQLAYRGDLSDFEDRSAVSITIENGRLTDISSHWGTTKFAYMFSKFFGRNEALFFALWIANPLLILLFVFFVIGRFFGDEDEEHIGEDVSSSEKDTND
ncbi:MAG: hypothetical protein COB46_02145 [Rhodospirillaceae bacterium]|nr:MAG: hypothetical protein COB46_02145 [Rhodospirillaceae bacterium]